MAKLTYEDKKEIIRLYHEKHYGCTTICRMMDVNKRVIDDLIRRYGIHGETALIETALIKHKNRKFNADLKLEIITRSINGEPKSSLAAEYKITRAQIINWLKKYEESGCNGLIDKSKGRTKTMKKEKKTIDPK